ncbi:hypothetical protein EC973_002431 [Apophysomyces ossiformis]|uniref:AMP-dependent synthetase/ligase domain-containing protein n=1 Tax=Apophysomyces ossiformis TaxID=679940 RepID=A0A8H7EMW8_9FUNG|nr:hypothetical protein EC973_002431 [Apophysomyces ossiformis]
MDSNPYVGVAAAGIGGLLGSMYLDSRLLLSRDWHQMRTGLAAQLYIRYWTWSDRLHLYYRFKDKAKATPDRVFVYFENKQYTFRQLEKASNRLAHWLLAQHVKKNDVVCMMLQNHPTFYILLFAIMKIGAVPSLINTNLSEDSLLHCVKIANAHKFIFDPIYGKQVHTISQDLNSLGISLYAYGEATEEQELPPLDFAPTITPSFLAKYSDKDTSEEYIKGIDNTSAGMLIYTR